MSDEVARVTRVRPAAERILHIRFAGDRRDHKLDLTGLIARSVHFAPLMDDPASFAKVAIIEDGPGVAWPIQTQWGRLDVSASTLRRIAEEQEPMTGTDFAEWRTELGLSLTEAAKLLGLGRRTIMGYLKKDELPPVVAIACRALARDKHLLAAALCAGAENQPACRMSPSTGPPWFDRHWNCGVACAHGEHRAEPGSAAMRWRLNAAGRRRPPSGSQQA